MSPHQLFLCQSGTPCCFCGQVFYTAQRRQNPALKNAPLINVFAGGKGTIIFWRDPSTEKALREVSSSARDYVAKIFPACRKEIKANLKIDRTRSRGDLNGY